AVLFLGLASVSFAQVAPIAKPGAPAPSASEENDDQDEATPSTVRTPAVAAQPAKTPAPPVANQPARPAPSVPRVIATPAQAAQTRPPPAAAANPRAGAPQMVQLQFPNSDVADVLRFYEQLTGKKLVMDNFVQGKVNIFIAKAVSRDEAIKIIEMSMALNGISLIPAAPDIIEVVGAGQNPRKAVVRIMSY